MPIIIFPNKKSFPIILVLMLLASGFLAWNLINTKTEGIAFYGAGNYFINSVLLAIVLYYTIFHAYNYLYAVYSRKARLIIDDTGIDDSLTIYSLGRIEWSDISLIASRRVLNIDVLLIKLKNPEPIIQRQSNWKRRYLRRVNKKWGTPVVLSQRLIDYNINDLAIEIKTRLNKALPIT